MDTLEKRKVEKLQKREGMQKADETAEAWDWIQMLKWVQSSIQSNSTITQSYAAIIPYLQGLDITICTHLNNWIIQKRKNQLRRAYEQPLASQRDVNALIISGQSWIRTIN